MDEERKKRFWEKLDHLEKFHNFLSVWIDEIDYDKLDQELSVSDYKNLFAFYHSAQLLIEAILDINAMIVKNIKNSAKDNYKNLIVLQKEKIISNNIFNHLKELTGLRNRIVHDYNGLIDKIAFSTIKEKYEFIELYKEEIKKWLRKL